MCWDWKLILRTIKSMQRLEEGEADCHVFNFEVPQGIVWSRGGEFREENAK
jgi:hypothetical protein